MQFNMVLLTSLHLKDLPTYHPGGQVIFSIFFPRENSNHHLANPINFIDIKLVKRLYLSMLLLLMNAHLNTIPSETHLNNSNCCILIQQTYKIKGHNINVL